MAPLKSFLILTVFQLYAISAVFAQSTEEDVLLVLGDSLSAAYGVKQEQGWVARLQTGWRDVRPNVRIINASVSGATTAAGTSRLPELLRQHRPRWLVLELGGNDGLQGKPIPYIRRHLVEMIEMARQQEVDVFLVGIRLPPNLGKRYVEPFFALYGKLAGEFGLGYMPFLLEGVAGIDKYMQEDGIHPSAAGQEAIYENIEPLLSHWVTATLSAGNARESE